jgi:hypothetical protein
MYSYLLYSILSTVLMRFDKMQYTDHNVSSNKYAIFLCLRIYTDCVYVVYVLVLLLLYYTRLLIRKLTRFALPFCTSQ